MNLYDMALLGLSNLWRTKLRTLLTVLGVVIGIGALTSMVSFGTGMQKNITDAFVSNDIFTSITVTPKSIDLNEIATGDTKLLAEAARGESKPLTDSILIAIRTLKGVQLAYPNLEFPARVKFFDDSASLTITAMPAAVGNYKPYSDLLAGSFFQNDSAVSLVLREEILASKLKVRLIKNVEQTTLSQSDSLQGMKLIHPDSLIGKSISLITMSVNPSGIPSALFGMMSSNRRLPIEETFTELKIGGILKQRSQFSSAFSGGQVIIPIATAESIPRLGFTSIWELLDNNKKEGTYGSIYVRIDDMKNMDTVKKELEAMEVGVFTIADQLQEIKRSFLILNSILGAIGAIALIVAGLGIINTMVMSILERTREIGVMKAIGGSETEIRMIFFVEAAVIGLVGALFGLVLGWIVTKIANLVMNLQIIPDGVEPVNLFYFPIWLIVGAIAFSILISLAAGLYPAMRAARIDPVKALRHD
jgi:putative ABC transport system permease protein